MEPPLIWQAIERDEVEAYNLPSGVLFQMHRAGAADNHCPAADHHRTTHNRHDGNDRDDSGRGDDHLPVASATASAPMIPKHTPCAANPTRPAIPTARLRPADRAALAAFGTVDTLSQRDQVSYRCGGNRRDGARRRIRSTGFTYPFARRRMDQRPGAPRSGNGAGPPSSEAPPLGVLC